jgi:hypothetical protein
MIEKKKSEKIIYIKFRFKYVKSKTEKENSNIINKKKKSKSINVQSKAKNISEQFHRGFYLFSKYYEGVYRHKICVLNIDGMNNYPASN